MGAEEMDQGGAEEADEDNEEVEEGGLLHG